MEEETFTKDDIYEMISAWKDKKRRITVAEDDDEKKEEQVAYTIDVLPFEEKLSGSVLAIELKNIFKDLSDARNKVVLQSHMENYGIDVENFDDLDFDEIPTNKDKCLNLSLSIQPENIFLLNLILDGVETKRSSIKKGEKRTNDNSYREKYLGFLRSCWTMSGAEAESDKLREKKIERKRRNGIVKNLVISISKVVFGFLFLGFEKCRHFGTFMFLFVFSNTIILV